MKRDCPLPSGASTWAYFRDSGGEAPESSVGQQLNVAREYATSKASRETQEGSGLWLPPHLAVAGSIAATTSGVLSVFS